MKANIILVKNFDEIMEAKDNQEKVGFGEVPERQFTSNAFLFNMEDVRLAFINENGFIQVLMHDEYFDFAFDERLWAELSERFK